MNPYRLKPGTKVECLYNNPYGLSYEGRFLKRATIVKHESWGTIVVKWDDGYLEATHWNQLEFFRVIQDCQGVTSKESFIAEIFK